MKNKEFNLTCPICKGDNDECDCEIPDEFNLSEKEIEVGEYHNGMLVYPEKHVKEFIKRLNKWKDIMRTWHIDLPTINLLCSEFDRFKNNLTGDKLK